MKQVIKIDINQTPLQEMIQEIQGSACVVKITDQFLEVEIEAETEFGAGVFAAEIIDALRNSACTAYTRLPFELKE